MMVTNYEERKNTKYSFLLTRLLGYTLSIYIERTIYWPSTNYASVKHQMGHVTNSQIALHQTGSHFIWDKKNISIVTRNVRGCIAKKIKTNCRHACF